MTMTANKLIAILSQLSPENRELPVFICHPGQCCCGDCFLPSDDYREVDTPMIWERPVDGSGKPYTLIIEL